MTIKEQILGQLELAGDSGIFIEDITKQINSKNKTNIDYKTIMSTISKLIKDGVVQKLKRGLYVYIPDEKRQKIDLSNIVDDSEYPDYPINHVSLSKLIERSSETVSRYLEGKTRSDYFSFVEGVDYIIVYKNNQKQFQMTDTAARKISMFLPNQTGQLARQHYYQADNDKSNKLQEFFQKMAQMMGAQPLLIQEKKMGYRDLKSIQTKIDKYCQYSADIMTRKWIREKLRGLDKKKIDPMSDEFKSNRDSIKSKFDMKYKDYLNSARKELDEAIKLYFNLSVDSLIKKGDEYYTDFGKLNYDHFVELNEMIDEINSKIESTGETIDLYQHFDIVNEVF